MARPVVALAVEAHTDTVAKGAAYLDRLFGPVWRIYIDLTRLDMSVSDQCILGQLFGDANRATKLLGLGECSKRGTLNYEMGFAHCTDTMDSKQLTAAWYSYLRNN